MNVLKTLVELSAAEDIRANHLVVSLNRLVEMVNEEMDSAARSYQGEIHTISDELAAINRRLGRPAIMSQESAIKMSRNHKVLLSRCLHRA